VVAVVGVGNYLVKDWPGHSVSVRWGETPQNRRGPVSAPRMAIQLITPIEELSLHSCTLRTT
jgi:hypothetical protein